MTERDRWVCLQMKFGITAVRALDPFGNMDVWKDLGLDQKDVGLKLQVTIGLPSTTGTQHNPPHHSVCTGSNWHTSEST